MRASISKEITIKKKIKVCNINENIAKRELYLTISYVFTIILLQKYFMIYLETI